MLFTKFEPKLDPDVDRTESSDPRLPRTSDRELIEHRSRYSLGRFSAFLSTWHLCTRATSSTDHLMPPITPRTYDLFILEIFLPIQTVLVRPKLHHIALEIWPIPPQNIQRLVSQEVIYYWLFAYGVSAARSCAREFLLFFPIDSVHFYTTTALPRTLDNPLVFHTEFTTSLLGNTTALENEGLRCSRLCPRPRCL